MARQQGNISAKKVSTAKKIDPAPSQLNNTAEMRDWYQKNKKNIENYAAAMEGAKSLRDITKTSTKAVTAYSKDSLRTYLQNIGSNEKNLRNLSRYLYYRCHAYYRLIAYNANMFCLDARSVIPEYDMAVSYTHLDVYKRQIKEHLKERKIIVNETIDDNVIENICLMIMKWNKEDKALPASCRKPIYLYLNSDGGDVISGYQVLSSIKTSVTPIITVGFAKCASMACYILAAGHKRYCFQNTVVLYHDGQTGYVSSSNKGKDIQKFYDKLEQHLNDFMVEHTNMTAEYLEEIKDREYYMFPDEAKEKGIVDKIIGIDCELSDIDVYKRQ